MDVDWGLWSAGLSLPLLSPSLQNKSRFAARRSPHGGQPGLWADPARQEEDVPLGEESPEALIELLKDQHSPWALPLGCSPQDQLLREVAVLEPELVRGSNVFQVLRSLRIIDKGVSAATGACKAAHLLARKPHLPVGREKDTFPIPGTPQMPLLLME